MWFPCLDDHERCTFDFEITAPLDSIVVCSGDMIDQIKTADRTRKIVSYRLVEPTEARSIMLAVGPFEVHPDPTIPFVTHFCLPGRMRALVNATAYVARVRGPPQSRSCSLWSAACSLTFDDRR